ncbi:zn 2cys6 transcription factor [Ilyonectria robusta]
MPLWQNAGSAADENGGLLSHNPSGTADLRALTDIQKYTRSNKLIWLPGRIVNYLTSRNAIRPADFALLPGQRFPIGVPQDQLFGRWNILDADLQKWYDSLSPTFQASARTKRHNTMPADDDFANLEEIWYELPICATTMQRYHMACCLSTNHKSLRLSE